MNNNNNKIQDPLSKLLVEDSKAIDREKLAALLNNVIFVSKDKGEINFTEVFSNLSNLDKIEMVFIADKARFLLLPEIKEEGLSQKEIIELDVMPQGSVKSSLNNLSNSRKIIKNKKGKYYIPNYRLAEIYKKYNK